MGGRWHGRRKEEEGRKKNAQKRIIGDNRKRVWREGEREVVAMGKKDPACGCGNRDQDDDRKDQEQEIIKEERSDMNQTISSEQSGEQSQGG